MTVDAPRSPTASTIRLHALGQLELNATSGDASAVLSQRKRVALLAYLALAGPRAPCGREMLATLFWPDSPADAARHSLREALRLLRRALGAELIVTRAGDDLGVDASLMWTDVAEFERAIGAGRNDDAMAIYRGPLLEGFTLREVSSEFEHWLDGERARLHAMAIRAASAITDNAERAGNVMLAARAARDCVRLAPFDEVLFRRLLALLERAGDSAGALHAYEAFAERLARELEVAPSPETQAIVARLRAGTVPPDQRAPAGAVALTSVGVAPGTSTHMAPERADADQGVDYRQDMPAATPKPLTSTRRWKRPLTAGRIVIVVSLMAIAVLGYVLRSTGHARAVADRSKPPTLAVLPFENLGSASDEYFVDGMTDEIRSRLAKLPGIAVIARTSVMQYKKTTKPITQIARELDGANFLIEGSVRWEKTPAGGGRVRVDAQVIRASDGTHVWADQFDEPYGTGIFAIQSDIAERVARALDVKLRPEDKPVVRDMPTSNLAAYDAYIRAQSYLDRDLGGQHWEAERRALEALEQAVRLDSSFAPAQALLALLHVRLVSGSGYDLGLATGIAPEERWEMARAAALRALASDSSSARAHRALSEYYREIAGDTTRSRAELALALRDEPSSADAITERGWWLVTSGRADDALREFEHARSLDPRNPTRWFTIAVFHQERRDLARFGEALERGIAVAPDVSMYIALAWQRLMIGRRDDARVALRNAIAQAGVNSVVYRLAQSTMTINMIRILPEDLARPAAEIAWAPFGADSGDYYWTKALAYGGDPARSRAYFDSLAAWARPKARAPTRFGELRVVLAWALAGAGRRDEAARELDDLSRGESRSRGLWREVTAESCLMIGRAECAVEQIARAIAESRAYTPAIFRLDPMWDPLRKRPDFAKLVEAHD